jgi:uncharacterized protein YndB with AHSA1/START domain
MTERNASFGTFSLERTYNHPVAKVFTAFAKQESKDKWFGGPPESWTPLERSFDFRPGGRESSAGRFHKTGTVSRFDAVYFEIVDNARIVYAYEMHLDDVRISVSLATIEFKPADAATRLTLTEQGVFVDGYQDNGSRHQGTSQLLDQLGASLAT